MVKSAVITQVVYDQWLPTRRNRCPTPPAPPVCQTQQHHNLSHARTRSDVARLTDELLSAQSWTL